MFNFFTSLQTNTILTTIKHKLVGLLLCLLSSHFITAQTTADSIEAKVNSAVREGRIVDQLSNQFSQFPKGEFLIAPENKDLKYGVVIYNIDLLPDRAIFSAAIAFRDPKSNQLIAFKADNISFSNSSGLTGHIKLFLVADVQINFGKCADILLYAGPRKTYATFECKGLKEFSIDGKVQFNNQFLLPVNQSNEIEPNKKLNANFSILAKSWSDLLVKISLDPFQIKGLKDFVFTISEATMDLSESSNDNNMIYPPIYLNEPNEIALWEGFYLKKGSVKLPQHFQTKDNKRTELGVENLLIDEWGFSGVLFAKNILRYEEGKIAQWPFSISNLEIAISRNEILSGKIEGEIGLPILPDTTRLGYKGYISTNDNYGFQILVNKTLSIPAFKISTLTLTPNSYMDMSINEGQIILATNFNGQLAIENKSNEDAKIPAFHFPAIEFQGLRVANTDPQFDIAYLGLKNTSNSAQQMGKYPIMIERIGIHKNGNDHALQIKFALNLMEKISVKSGLSINTNYSNNQLLFKSILLEAMELNSSISCFTLNGRIQFIKQDPYFGNGLSGSIQFKMNQPKISAASSILFGNINSQRYWYVDANAIWDQPALPFLPGTEINGFMGGAWQGMREKTQNDQTPNNELGLSASGKYYVPDQQAGLGFRAGIYLRSTGGSKESKPFIAKTALEIQFNNHLGINQLSIFGNADFMTKNTTISQSDLKQNTSTLPSVNNWKSYVVNYQPVGNISSPFSLNFDFAQQVYQANFAVYIQGISGNKILGGGQRGLAGEVAAYFSKSKWYLKIGTPQQPLNVKMKLGQTNTADLNAYFMAGHDLPSAAPLPKEITSMIGNKNADAMRSLEELNIGNAFAFGSRLNLQIGSEGGDKNISIYASLKALIGLDINVRPTNNSTFCSSNNETPGINGWFANGQLFAFLQGRVGASVQTKAIKSQFDLLTLTTAAQLYCEGPKPFYSNGSASVKVNIAGVINKQIKLNFEIGEPCSLKQNKLSDTSIILTINPENNSSNFNVAKNVATQFSIPVNTTFKDAEGRDFIFSLKQYTLSDNGHDIAGQLNFNSTKTLVTFDSKDLLPANKKLNLKIIVQAQLINSTYELRNKNNQKVLPNNNELSFFNNCVANMKSNQQTELDFGMGRKLVRVDQLKPYLLNGSSISETKEITFFTGAGPTGIIEANIASTYPVKNQMNYHKEISNLGHLQLIKNQQNLSNLNNKKIVVLMADNSGKIIAETNANYNNNRVTYSITNTLLKNNAIYQIIIKIKSTNAASEIGNNLANTNSSKNITTINTAQINSDIILYSYYFGTSNYSTFAQKTISFSSNSALGNNKIITTHIKNNLLEYFDAIELSKDKPLVKICNSMMSNDWMNKEGKKIYAIFKLNDPILLSLLDLNRDTAEQGLIPSRSIFLKENQCEQMTLTTSGINGCKKQNYTTEPILLENNALGIMYNDFEAIKTALVQYVNTSNPNYSLINSYLNSLSYSSSNQLLNANSAAPNSSINSLKTQNQPTATTNTNSSINLQKTNCLLRISQLQFNCTIPKQFNYQWYYYLPSNTTPVNSFNYPITLP